MYVSDRKERLIDLMSYQPLWLIQCQVFLIIRFVLILFILFNINPFLHKLEWLKLSNNNTLVND